MVLAQSFIHGETDDVSQEGGRGTGSYGDLTETKRKWSGGCGTVVEGECTSMFTE